MSTWHRIQVKFFFTRKLTKVSSNSIELGFMHKIIFILPFPSKKFLNKRVNFESLYGTILLKAKIKKLINGFESFSYFFYEKIVTFLDPFSEFSLKTSMQFLRAISDEFILPASLSLDPVFLVRFVLSLPAKSTNDN
jgi:hypothetical protein